MGIFSTDIIEEPWVGLAYELLACTSPKLQDTVWNDAFSWNFSKTKLKQKLKELAYRSDGSTKLSKDEIDRINNFFNQNDLGWWRIEYKYIIFICLFAPALDEQILSNIFSSCLSKIKSENDNVCVEIRCYNPIPDYDSVTIIIKVNTFTPQIIQITLKKK